MQDAIIDVSLFGMPLEGTFRLIWPSLDALIPIGDSPPVLEFNTDDDAAAALAVMLTHPELETGDVLISGGPWPNATMRFRFTAGMGNRPVTVPLGVWTYMAGGYGMGILCTMSQLGHR